MRENDSIDRLNYWHFQSGNAQDVTDFTCDEYSLIRITLRWGVASAETGPNAKPVPSDGEHPPQ